MRDTLSITFGEVSTNIASIFSRFWEYLDFFFKSQATRLAVNSQAEGENSRRGGVQIQDCDLSCNNSELPGLMQNTTNDCMNFLEEDSLA